MDSQTFTEAAESAADLIYQASEQVRDMRILANGTWDGIALREMLDTLDTIYHDLTIYAAEGLGA